MGSYYFKYHTKHDANSCTIYLSDQITVFYCCVTFVRLFMCVMAPTLKPSLFPDGGNTRMLPKGAGDSEWLTTHKLRLIAVIYIFHSLQMNSSRMPDMR